MTTEKRIHGLDPLALLRSESSHLREFVEEANKRVVLNILKSYAGYFDIFNEPLQNALDSVAMKAAATPGFKPRLWIEINIRDRFVRVVDNGLGMDEEQFKFCLCPNISFKRDGGQRGNKGVGATFLAYGFAQLEIQARDGKGDALAARLRNGRAWANDAGDSIPRPTLEEFDFHVPELLDNQSGVAVKIILGGAIGEKPKNLNWLGAVDAEQWFDILRIKTPLGGVYLSSPQFKPSVHLRVVGPDGVESIKESNNAEYFYPHELPVVHKAQDLKSINKALQGIEGDYATQRARLANEYRRLDCIYEIWDREALTLEDSPFADIVRDESNRELIERHSVVVYGAFLCSAKLWGRFIEDHLKLRKSARVIHGGLQLACDQMVQGDLFVIPLTSTIGYQANAHVIVHFTDGSPDMGRKVFQPELKNLADLLAIRAVGIFKRYLTLLRNEAAAPGAPTKALYEWKKSQETYRSSNGLSFQFGNGKLLSLVSSPQQEQDVVALFHELLGLELIRGYRIMATSSHDRYDSLYVSSYEDSKDSYGKSCPLGVGTGAMFGEESEPKILEYKHDFDSLVDDFSKDVKAANEISLVVTWIAERADYGNLYLKSLLVGDEGSERVNFGATHQVYFDGHPNMSFEVIVLKDLLAYIQDPNAETARHRSIYK